MHRVFYRVGGHLQVCYGRKWHSYTCGIEQQWSNACGFLEYHCACTGCSVAWVVISRCVTVGSGILILGEWNNCGQMFVVSLNAIVHARGILSCGWSSPDVLRYEVAHLYLRNGTTVAKCLWFPWMPLCMHGVFSRVGGHLQMRYYRKWHSHTWGIEQQ